MNDLDDSVLKHVLSRARQGWSPGADDLQRVRRGIDAALAHGLPGAARTPRPSAVPPWVGRVLLTAAFTAAGAGAGYWAGRRAPRSDRPAVPAPSLLRVVAPAVSPPSATPPLAPPAPVIAPPQAARRAEPSRRRSAEVPPGTPAESLAVETLALRNAERALRDGNPGLASAFLDDLDRAVPAGQMREERAAVRTIARCAAGQQPFGVNLADEFTAAYPSSAYHGRVQQACGTDSRATGD